MASLSSGLLTATIVFAATLCVARPPAPGHPIIGTWTVTNFEGTCKDLWKFRADGTTQAVSGSEEATSEYEIADLADVPGAYRLVDTVTKTNGKPDCTGNRTPVGDRVVLFLLPTSSGGLMVCISPDGRACMGTMIRAAMALPDSWSDRSGAATSHRSPASARQSFYRELRM